MTMRVWEEEWRVDSCDRLVVVTGPDPDAGDTSDIGEMFSEDRARLAATAPEMARVLLGIEWSGRDFEGCVCCPSCEGAEGVAHYDHCELDAALKKAGVR